MTTIDQQFVEFIVKTLVNNPDKVLVEREIDERGVLLSLTVDPEDVGRVIGKRGATAQSIRTLLRVLGTKNDARYNLKIVNGDDFESATQSRKATEPTEAASPTADSDSAAATDAPEAAPETDAPAADSDKTTENSESELAEKTRAELADLDDLDI